MTTTTEALTIITLPCEWFSESPFSWHIKQKILPLCCLWVNLTMAYNMTLLSSRECGHQIKGSLPPSPWHWWSCTLNTVYKFSSPSLRQIWKNWSGLSRGLQRRSSVWSTGKRWRELSLFSLAKRRLQWSNSGLQLLEGELQRCSQILFGNGSWYHKGQWLQACRNSAQTFTFVKFRWDTRKCLFPKSATWLWHRHTERW